MAKKSHLQKGDTLTLKWRDKSGAIDAKDVLNCRCRGYA